VSGGAADEGRRSFAGAVLAALLERGIDEFVVCAGARNAALVEGLVALEAAGGVRLWRHFEERSAAFFALGRTMATGLPCAVVTTSGTAAAELLPAMVEARLQGRPLVAVTADRPRRFRGSGAPQAIAQAALFGVHAEGCDDLAEDGEIDPASVLAAWSGHAPWQINVCLEEDASAGPFRPLAVGPFRPARQRIDVAPLVRFLREDAFRGTVLLLGGLEPADREETWHFATGLAAPVVAEAASGLREALGQLALADPDRLLRARPPGRVLRIGEVPSGRFWRDLEELPATAVCSVTRTGLPGLARPSLVIPGEPHRVLAGLGGVEAVGDTLDLLRQASRRRAQTEELLERFPESEPALLRTLSVYAACGASLYLGNSLPIREWNLFAQWRRPLTEVRANRGANGIDGQLSTWLGCTAGQDEAWAVVGDLTALYDLSAPSLLEQAGGAGRVCCVINNGGGRIFERLPRLRTLPARATELMLNPHRLRLDHWAALWGMGHLRVESADDFDRLDEMPRPLVLELVPDAAQTAAFWLAWDAWDDP
jgi:2-succinyl-5-enolpyruvyl-6-hydroxy-3-cyclohexene-1-carboxylate synthase